MAERAVEIHPQFVEFVPEELLPRVLYISERFNIALHLCCCGCGEEVVTPLNNAGWEIFRMSGKVSIWPSIGNWDYPCQSHYFIKRNRVVWAEPMAKAAIQRVKQRDKHDRSKFLEEVNATKITPDAKGNKPSWRQNCFTLLRRLIGSRSR